MTEERNIQDVLAEVAERAEETRDEAVKMYRSKQPPTGASQVYSIRIPVSRLENIRKLAARYGVPPTSMLRSWILERLDLEEQSASAPHSETSPIADVAATKATAIRMPPTSFAVNETAPSRGMLERRLQAYTRERHRRMAEV